MPSARDPAPIPVNLVTGPLGAGKTTTINHLLSQRPDGEQWAILVNEYGQVGIDGALLDGAGPSGVEIREVAGGCICCSAGVMFKVSLVTLLRRRPDRLIIEPTGLATLSGIMDTLGSKGIREAVELRSVVCLMDPATFERQRLREEVVDQVEAADVLLASRADLAGSDDLAAFAAWAQGLFPRKRHVGRVEHGQIPISMLDLAGNRNVPQNPAVGPDHHHGRGHEHNHSPDHGSESAPLDAAAPLRPAIHRSSHASTLGWIVWSGLIFDADRVTRWVGRLRKLPGNSRTKAVLHTTDGWLSYNIIGESKTIRPSGHRRDSRVEVILEGEAFPNHEALEQALLDCVAARETEAPTLSLVDSPES